jgi:hypothetical protein
MSQAVLTETGAQRSAVVPIDPSWPSVGAPDDWTGGEAPVEGVVLIPDHIDPTNPRRVYDLAHRAERKYLYEVVLVDGTGTDINRFIARTILVDLWDGLYLPRAVRSAWATTIDTFRPDDCEQPRQPEPAP